jgi:two-component system, sensor histidine kinase LadS
MMLKETHYSYKPGVERIVLYTDGLTEARNKEEDMFEVGKLSDAALQTLDCDPTQTVEKILTRQKSFCGSQQIPEDDITLLVLDL